MATESIPARLFQRAEEHPSAPAYYIKEGASWTPTSWADYAGEVRQVARALIACGFESGETTTILGFNHPEWVILDVATMAAGGAPAGIYTTCSPNEVQYIIDHSGARFVLVENHDQWKKIDEERDNLPNLEHVILMRGNDPIDDPLVSTWEEFLAKGDDVEEGAVDERLAGLEPDQMATLIYTSGTTGPPKAVMLSHRNLTWTADTAESLLTLGPEDCALSYLPLSHIAEQMFTIHVPISHGVRVYFAESLDDLPENLKEVQPTVFFGVPRIWEKFHAAVAGKMKDATGIKAKLVSWAMNVGEQVVALRCEGKEPSGLLAMQYGLADKLIFSKVKPLLGLARVRAAVSGAAPISKEVIEFFSGLDVMIQEVYGQSEGSGPTTFNIIGATKFGTVGKPLPGMDVKIADDGEIVAKGPNIFLGYYKDPEATAETLVDGWLHSGDLGSFDEDGFLTITGRKKEIIITAGGKNIAPKNIEASLKNDELINEAVVIGDRRKFLSALVTLDPEALEKFAAKHGIDGESAHEDDTVIAHVQSAVDATNKLFARVEHIRKFRILPRNLSIEEGELTPTLKVKRNKVEEKWSDTIEEIYAD